MIVHVELTQFERILILQALNAVTPTGGGSPQHSLFCRLQSEWGEALNETATREELDAFWGGIGKLQKIAWQEYQDYVIDPES